MAVYYTADLHLGHKNILQVRTQFQSIDEHDAFLLDKWNEKVTDSDEVYILGDLSYKSQYHISHYLSRMKGRKHLVIGNHDHTWMKNVKDMSEYFETTENLNIIKFEGKLITLCHYPLLEWAGSRHADAGIYYLIHGHIHGEKHPETYGYIKEHRPHAFNAGVDVNGFEPVTFEQLKENNRIWYGREE